VKVKIAKNFFAISILTGKFFILDILTVKINMHILNVTYLKSKVEIKGISDTHRALNLESMRKEVKISCLPRCSRQNEITKMTFEGKKIRVS